MTDKSTFNLVHDWIGEQGVERVALLLGK
jgi:hypothetical protein